MQEVVSLFTSFYTCLVSNVWGEEGQKVLLWCEAVKRTAAPSTDCTTLPLRWDMTKPQFPSRRFMVMKQSCLSGYQHFMESRPLSLCFFLPPTNSLISVQVQSGTAVAPKGHLGIVASHLTVYMGLKKKKESHQRLRPGTALPVRQWYQKSEKVDLVMHQTGSCFLLYCQFQAGNLSNWHLINIQCQWAFWFRWEWPVVWCNTAPSSECQQESADNLLSISSNLWNCGLTMLPRVKW